MHNLLQTGVISIFCVVAGCGAGGSNSSRADGSGSTRAAAGTGGNGGAGHVPLGTGGSNIILVPDAGSGVSAACADAINNKRSVGCEYYATFMDTFAVGKTCFAAIVANAGRDAAHIEVEYDGKKLSVSDFTRIPSGSGPRLTYAPFDEAAGIAPGEVAILFLYGQEGELSTSDAPCPVRAALRKGVPVTTRLGDGATGIGKSFRITSDVPVVAYQINPYGGGSAAVTGASLLLPTSAWDTDYVAVNIYETVAGISPSLNIVASQDSTTVTLVPIADVEGNGDIPSGKANEPMKLTLSRGEHAQITQRAALTGSMVQSDKPVGFMAGHQCMMVPADSGGPCDHGEQMIPPVEALGSEYVGVMYRPRVSEPALWRVIGAVDGTKLSFSTPVGGPATLSRGEVVEFVTAEPFIVKSQDKEHPFILLQYMSSNGWKFDEYRLYLIGDPDSVLAVPPEQFLSEYVFFADPTYPITNLVVVRAKKDGAFADVILDCAGPLSGWQPIGDYEWTRVDLSTGLFENVGRCNTGRHEIKSDAPFGISVWGWGNGETEKKLGISTQSVSYGYPGGMNVATINEVKWPPPPK